MACSRGPITRDQLADATLLARADAINAARDEGRTALRAALIDWDVDAVIEIADGEGPTPAADRALIWAALCDYDTALDASGWEEDRR